MIGDDVGNLVGVFGAEGHAWVSQVGDARNGFVELVFGECFRKEQEGTAESGKKVVLVCEPDGGVVTEDLDGFVEASGEIKSFPIGEISFEGVDVDDAVFDDDSVDVDVGIEVNTRAHVVLDVGYCCTAEFAHEGVVVGMLVEVERVEVLGVGYAEDEVNHGFLCAVASALGKDAAAICEGIFDGCAKGSEQCFELCFHSIIDLHILVRTKIPGKISRGELRKVEVDIFILGCGCSFGGRNVQFCRRLPVQR